MSVAYRQGAGTENTHSICEALPLESLEIYNDGDLNRPESHRTVLVFVGFKEFCKLRFGKQNVPGFFKSLKVFREYLFLK